MDSDKFGRMTIDLDKVSKRYVKEWILKNLSFTFQKDYVYGIRGANGSGKSTLLKMISGHLSPTVGTIGYQSDNGEKIDRDEVHKRCTMWGPHVSMVSQLTIEEMVTVWTGVRSSKSL